MTVEAKTRQSVTIEHGNWNKYVDFKTKWMREFGKPELSFTEYMNACIYFSNMTQEHIIELRKKARKA